MRKNSILSKILKLTGIAAVCYLGYYFLKGFIIGSTKEDITDGEDADYDEFGDPSIEVEDFFADEE